MKKGFVSVSCMVFALMAFASPGFCEEEKVLLKIDDIKPIKNANGDVENCNFGVMVYNRSGKDIEGASVEIRWVDNTISLITKEEEQENARAGSRKAAATTDANTVAMLIDIPDAGSYKQVAMRANLKTDRCFLLLGDATLNVRNCKAKMAQAQAEGGNRGGERQTACAPFELVSAKDPQYYKEFKKLSLEEQRKLDQSQLDKDKDVISAEHSKVMGILDESNTILKSIKAPQQ